MYQKVLHNLTGGILVVSALAKCLSIGARPHPIDGLFWIVVPVVIECIAAAALVFYRGQHVQILSATMFFFFAIVSFKSAIQGEVTCGCFGDLKLPPALVGSMDLALSGGFGCLLIFSNKTRNASRIGNNIMLCLFLTFLVAACYALSIPRYTQLSEYSFNESSGLVYLHPPDWIKQVNPLLELVEKKERHCLEDKKLIFLLDPECPKCRQLIRHLSPDPQASSSLVYTEMPSDPNGQIPFCVLDDRNQWLISGPWKLTVEQGVVNKAEPLD